MAAHRMPFGQVRVFELVIEDHAGFFHDAA